MWVTAEGGPEEEMVKKNSPLLTEVGLEREVQVEKKTKQQ